MADMECFTDVLIDAYYGFSEWVEEGFQTLLHADEGRTLGETLSKPHREQIWDSRGISSRSQRPVVRLICQASTGRWYYDMGQQRPLSPLAGLRF